MKKLLLAFSLAGFLGIILTSQALAASSSAYFTALQTSNGLDYTEIYNDSNVPINMNDWSVEATIVDSNNPSSTFTCSIQLNGWLRPSSYGVVAEKLAILDDNNALVYDGVNCSQSSFTASYVAKLELKNSNNSLLEWLNITPSQTGWPWVREYISSVSENYKKSEIFTNDFGLASSITRRPALLSGGWYDGPPSSSVGLEIDEILPNARNCSPLETSLDCGDYIKLHNSSNHNINLADYRLRVGYKGQSPNTSNTFTWGQEIDPSLAELILPAGQYFTLTTKNDGAPISVPDSGDFVWLEDFYGQQIYSSVVEYPSATSTKKVGYSWAFDGKDWQWTSTPQPNAPNYFFLPAAMGKTTSANTLKSCRVDQFRNPLTNRCKKKSSTASSLKSCRSDQFRNPATNRCKSKSSAANTLKPCKSNQFRNPDTNRCKSKTSVGSSLKPCKPGQKRNPETNRCRKTGQVAGAAVQKIEETPEDTSASWWLAGVAGLGAVGYGVYEWRTEIIAGSRRLLQLVKTK